jgi:hypothetical protein
MNDQKTYYNTDYLYLQQLLNKMQLILDKIKDRKSKKKISIEIG